MKFGRFKKDAIIKSGIVIEDNLYFFQDIFGEDIDLKDFVEKFSEENIRIIREKIEKISSFSVKDYEVTAPFVEPRRNVICLGKNYLDHVNECGTGGIDKDLGRPKEPIFFTKMINKFVEPKGNIIVDEKVTDSLDYEGELAVIIGKEGKNIKASEVYSYIFGYTIINDSSARDLQKKHSQWFKGKSIDDTCSFGPYILYKEEISYPPVLDLFTYVNGELRQKGNTRDFIFDLAYSISEFSRGTTLKPGDIIATGTPQGVGMGFIPPKFLKNNDILKIEIEKIGVLENKICNYSGHT